MAKKKYETAEEVLKGQSAPVIVEKGKEQWHGQTLEAPNVPIIDPGIGKPIIIRKFLFGRNPEFKGGVPTKQDLFNMHWKQIRTILWGDGLVPYEEVQPRVEPTKDGQYMIILACIPRLHTLIADTPNTLNELLPKTKGKSY